ncbi:hypothetical protein [Amycolatopsis japonica]
MADKLPKLPAVINVQVGVHAHIVGRKLHDDHICDYVACALCGKPGKELVGVWLDIVLE